MSRANYIIWHAPYAATSSGNSTPSQPSVTFSPWSGDSYTYIRKTDAALGQDIRVSNGNCTDAGMYLYDANGNQIASASNGSYSSAEPKIYFQVNTECDYTLTPGTTYKYKFYAVVDGKTYWSQEYSFKTAGTSSYTVTVSASPSAGGTVTGGGSYESGKSATVTATPNEGYTFKGWMENGSTVSTSHTFTVSANRTLTAVFEKMDPCANGHTWGGWTVSTTPTCTRAGQRTHVCTQCGKQETEAVALPGHNYQLSGGFFVCTRCGDILNNGAPTTSGLGNFKPSYTYYNGLFRDIPSNTWYTDNVSLAYQLGLMKGQPDNTFSPGSNVTYAETIAVAARIHSIYYYGAEKFETYDGGIWYNPYVNYARVHNISTANYNYTQPATREEFVHILVNSRPREALTEIPGKILNFADKQSIVYGSDVDRLCKAGVINGIDVGGVLYFMPNKTITRAEMSAIITRMVQPNLRIP